MAWSSTKEGTLPSLKDKPLDVRQKFSEVANKSLLQGSSEDEAIKAGLSAVTVLEHNKKKIAKATLDQQKQIAKDKEDSYSPPPHLAALLEAVEIRKNNEQLEIQKKSEERASIVAEVIAALKDINDSNIVDMLVNGEDVILVKQDGKKVKRRLADYNVEQKIITAIQNQAYLEPCSGFNSLNEPELLFSSEGDVMMLESSI